MAVLCSTRESVFHVFSTIYETLMRSLSSSRSITSSSVYVITPDSTGLRVDGQIFGTYLGSSTSLLSDPPPAESITSKDCVYLFLEISPSSPSAIMHDNWIPTLRTTHCRVMAMVNTDQFTKALLDTPKLELMICKTHQCKTWVQQQQESRATKIPIFYSGFTSMEVLSDQESVHDNTKNEIKNDRFTKFLHVAGSSPHKGTSNILQAWLLNPQWPTLTITSHNNKLLDIILPQIKQQLGISQLPPNILHIDTKLSREEIAIVLTSHGVHLCLSGMEGFGHYLNEARAVGALAVTTDYPPMNEMVTPDTGVLVPPSKMLEWTNKLPFANVETPQIVAMMENIVLPMTLAQRAERGARARMAFEHDRHNFREQIERLTCYIRDCRQGDMDCANAKCAWSGLE